MNYAEIQIGRGKKKVQPSILLQTQKHIFQFNSIIWWKHRQNGQKIHVEPMLSSYE